MDSGVKATSNVDAENSVQFNAAGAQSRTRSDERRAGKVGSLCK